MLAFNLILVVGIKREREKKRNETNLLLFPVSFGCFCVCVCVCTRGSGCSIRNQNVIIKSKMNIFLQVKIFLCVCALDFVGSSMSISLGSEDVGRFIFFTFFHLFRTLVVKNCLLGQAKCFSSNSTLFTQKIFFVSL